RRRNRLACVHVDSWHTQNESVKGRQMATLAPDESGLLHPSGPVVAAGRPAASGPEVGQVIGVTHESLVQAWLLPSQGDDIDPELTELGVVRGVQTQEFDQPGRLRVGISVDGPV